MFQIVDPDVEVLELVDPGENKHGINACDSRCLPIPSGTLLEIMQNIEKIVESNSVGADSASPQKATAVPTTCDIFAVTADEKFGHRCLRCRRDSWVT